MPSVPSQALPDVSQIQRPRSIPSFESDTAERTRRRDEYETMRLLPVDQYMQLTPRSAALSSSHMQDTEDAQLHSLLRRQTYISNLPATYAGINAGPSAGTVVGIVLGVVLGYLLLFWLVVAVIGNRARATYYEGDDTEIVVRRDHHSSRRSKRSHKSRRARTEASEVSERPPPPRPRREPSPRRTERIFVQETRRTESRPPPPPMSPPSNVREDISININESRGPDRVQGDDEVRVEEEASSVSQEPTPRRKRGGVRHVDPSQYAGGNYPTHEFSRSRSRR